jgi:hypothetical protein
VELRAGRHQPGRDEQRERRDQRGRREHPPPRHPRGGDAGEHDAGRGAEHGDAAPPGHRVVVADRVGEDAAQHRGQGGRDERGPDPLAEAGADQHRIALRVSGGDRRRGEHEQADEQHPPPAVAVGEPPAEEQQPAERQRVRRADQDQLGPLQAQLATDRGKWHRHHGDREDECGLHQREQCERAPAPGHHAPRQRNDG